MEGINDSKYQEVSCFSDGTPVPDLLTQEELIQFLRIPQVSKSKDYSNVVKNLIRFRNLPRIEICNKLLYPKKAVLDWVKKETNLN